MDPADHLAALEKCSEAFVTAARGSLERPVPSCPDWDVAGLVVHLGSVWAWAADVVTTGQRAGFPEPPEDRGEPALLTWAQAQAERLLTALGAADPDSDCWTFGLPRTRRFWFRRQALEAALHTWDAQNAGHGPEAIDPGLAADGVDEFLTVMVPRWLARSPGGWSGESLHFHRTDGEGEWLVRLGPDGEATTERSHAKGDVALRGPAEALWLWCCNRSAGSEAIEIFGDRAVAQRWSAAVEF